MLIGTVSASEINAALTDIQRQIDELKKLINQIKR